MTDTPYQQLESRFQRLMALGDAEAMLQWDWAAMMPCGAAEARSEQLAALKAVGHGILISPEIEELLEAAENDGGLDLWQAADLRKMKHMRLHASALTEELVTALSKASSACETVWRTARPEADFAAVRPSLEALLKLVREAAAAKAERLALSPYDALLDQYDPSARAADIDAEFSDLEGFLPDFLQEVLSRQKQSPAAMLPRGPFPVKQQRRLSMRLMTALGFDFNHGRLDVSLHPFCGGSPDDVRITTRYDKNDFTSSIMGVLHETGHALYEMGLPKEQRGRPVRRALGMSIHESQSLLIEMQVCRSRDFLSFAAPLFAEAFNGEGPAWEADNLFGLYTKVEPGFIRVVADEVTYPSHVIIRYRLERAMIAGDLQVADLPAAWNEGMKRMLGLTPPDDREGCLQDIHWFGGDWGYFPTYTLGAMAAAQLFEAAKNSDKGIVEGIRQGDFTPLLAWLRENVHSKGSLLTSRDLMTKATGRPLNPDAFKRHLRQRYSA